MAGKGYVGSVATDRNPLRVRRRAEARPGLDFFNASEYARGGPYILTAAFTTPGASAMVNFCGLSTPDPSRPLTTWAWAVASAPRLTIFNHQWGNMSARCRRWVLAPSGRSDEGGSGG